MSEEVKATQSGSEETAAAKKAAAPKTAAAKKTTAVKDTEKTGAAAAKKPAVKKAEAKPAAKAAEAKPAVKKAEAKPAVKKAEAKSAEKPAAVKADAKLVEKPADVKKAPANPAASRIKITLVKSTISGTAPQKANVQALGLRKIRDTKVQYDTPIIRGMIRKVAHLVRVEAYNGEDV